MPVFLRRQAAPRTFSDSSRVQSKYADKKHITPQGGKSWHAIPHRPAVSKSDARFASWKYFRFEVSPADLPQALSRLHTKRFRGINLTVPHKVLAVEHLAGIHLGAKAVGAVNTLLWTEQGWYGHNTDGYGLAMGVKEDLGIDLAGSHIILLGAGGAARGAAVELCIAVVCSASTRPWSRWN